MKQLFFISLFSSFCFIGCAKKESMADDSRIDSMKKAARGWVEALNSHKLDDLDKYISNDVIEHTSLSAREGHLTKDWLPGIKKLIDDGGNKKTDSDTKITIEDIRAEGDICVMRGFTVGTKTVDSSGVMVKKRNNKVETYWMRWENGKFVEAWWDIKD